MESKTRELEISLGDLLDVFKKFWIILLAVFIASLSVITALSYVFHRDNFQSTAKICISIPKDKDATQMSDTSYVSIANFLFDMIEGYADSYDQLYQKVVDKAQAAGYKDVDLEYVEKVIKFDADTTSKIFSIVVLSSSKDLAVMIANDSADIICSYINSLYEYAYLSVNDYAKDYTTIVANKVSLVKIGLISLGITVVLYGVLLVVYLLDDKIKNEKDVEKLTDLTLLGNIPNVNKTKKHGSYYYSAYYTRKIDEGEKK